MVSAGITSDADSRWLTMTHPQCLGISPGASQFVDLTPLYRSSPLPMRASTRLFMVNGTQSFADLYLATYNLQLRRMPTS
jgi:hypothetical protein